MAKQVKIETETDEKLAALSKRRKERGAVRKSRQDVVALAIELLYEQEIGEENERA